MNRLFLIAILIISFGESKCQEIMNKDSLLRALNVAIEDSNKALLLIHIAEQYEGNDINLSKDYYHQANLLSKKIGFSRGLIKYAAGYTFLLNQQGRFDSSVIMNRQAMEIAKQAGDEEYLAKSTFNYATSLRYAGFIDSSIVYYEAGSRLMEKVGNEFTAAFSKDILQTLYQQLGQYDKAIALGEQSLSYFRNYGNDNILATVLINLGCNYSAKGLQDKSLVLFKEALQLSRKEDNNQTQVSALLDIANYHIQKNEYEKARPYFDTTLLLSRGMDNPEGETISLRGIAICQLFAGRFQEAKASMQQSLAISKANNMRQQHSRNLETMSSILYALHDMAAAEQCLRESTQLGDSIVGDKVQELSIRYEKKFETEKKENQIQLQKNELQQNKFLNYVLSGGSMAVILITVLLVRNYHQKQKIQRQRIAELETEKQLAATELVLKGEEQERTRLAKDLHDGLGGMLSGIKYSFQSMKGNLIMTPENAQAFERSMDMLDSSIKEMRRVAHNMMPEALVKFGLDAALKDFCSDINQSGALQVNYQSLGLKDKDAEIPQTTSITVFRIVQELLNNVIKHASARNSIVQVSKSGNVLSITVEDDGRGFNTSILNATKGIGWSNIQNRIELLKGTLDVNSTPENGTSVHIEIGTV